jgi:hypothetical protein
MLVPLCKHERALSALRKGIAVSVICDADDYDAHYRDNYYRMLGFSVKTKTKTCTILSEVANMPNHYVVVGAGGRMVCGLHSDIFYIDVEDDVEEDDCWINESEEIYNEEPPEVLVDDCYRSTALNDIKNALVFCEDVLSRRPLSTELHLDGSHPNDRINQVRSAIQVVDELFEDLGLQSK